LVAGLHFEYLLALIISSAIALIWNFSLTKFVIWRNDDTNGKEEQKQ
jgi:putative flippase GtrA